MQVVRLLLGYKIKVRNAKIGEAISKFPKKKQDIMLLSFFLDMSGYMRQDIFVRGLVNLVMLIHLLLQICLQDLAVIWGILFLQTGLLINLMKSHLQLL